jgi:formate dehydrogenase subunit gamma
MLCGDGSAQIVVFKVLDGPPMTALSAADSALVQRIAGEHSHRPGPLLEVLHAVQHTLGFVPVGAIPIIARELNLSRAEVHGVVTFYHHFRSAKPGRAVIQVCRAEACQSMRGAELEAHAKAKLGVDYHETTPDGRYSLEPVYCLGNCACAPSVMIGEEIHGRVTPERFDALIAGEHST